MFSKIDDVHREGLRTYCHLLKWASETKHKTYYASLCFVTTMSQYAEVTSLEQFVKTCSSREQQIVVQSQCLIEVGRQKHNPVIGLLSV